MLPELEVVEDMTIEVLKHTGIEKTDEEWIQLLICAMAADPTPLEEMPNKFVSRYSVDNGDCPLHSDDIRIVANVIRLARIVYRCSPKKEIDYELENSTKAFQAQDS